ncbi:MAG: Ni/Fe hydrogenase subunit alpha [Nanoarchaeota archaeon]|nr:Ni/Fe hydrogenase subunit alpha [Nanoarchaeota archaeon]
MEKINLNHITKIEGHARLSMKVEDGQLQQCELGSIEGSRYFEGLLKGRRWYDAPEITSRICGICSTAHGICSVMAMEKALDIEPSKQTLILRELQNLGERFRSHATHLYFLALPDYLGYESALSMAPRYKKEIERALRLVKLGNDLTEAISGRVMHQVATTIGGFTHFPTQDQLDTFKELLIAAEDDIQETARLFASLPNPHFEREVPSFSVVRDDSYAFCYGDIKIGEKVFKQENYADILKEYHESYSNANFVVIDGKDYYVGALARVNNNYDKLHPKAKAFLEAIKFKVPCFNPYLNNLAQAVELIHHRESAIELLNDFKVQHEELVKPDVKAGKGIAANEAPRGTLWHEYEIDDNGIITHANIVTPTAQALLNMEKDIKVMTQKLLDEKAPKDDIVMEIEKLIRNYDPCFSCATHFLEVDWDEK